MSDGPVNASRGDAGVRVGVVLGGGGPLGWAFHLGVIRGVRDAIDREPGNADRIVGTSAGGAIAATLLTGTPVDEVIEMISAPPGEDERALMQSAGRDALRSPLRALRPLAPRLALRARTVGPTTALAGLLPAGLFPTLMLRRFGADAAWPEPLWIPSVRIDDGEVVVFGRDATVGLGDAIGATSAVPGVFQPKTIDGIRYVDGAVASSTHADLLVGEELDIVLISAPTTRAGGGPIRSRARRQLAEEVDALNAAGARTLVLTPNDEVLAAAEGFPRGGGPGNDAAAIVEAARLQTIAAFAARRPAG